MAALNILPVVAVVMVPDLFLRFSILWVGIWFSLVAYLNGRWLMKIWNRHLPKPETEKENPHET
jgi:hypothetical protein